MTEATKQVDATLRYGDAELSGPVQLIEKGLYLGFAAVALWIWCWALDAGRPYFEKKGYRRITVSILAVKLIGFSLFIAFIIFGFWTGRI